MKICFYARQQCRWPDRACPKDEELRPVFASSPELAVRKVWGCQWAGSRLTLAAYLMHLVEEKKLKSAHEIRLAKILGEGGKNGQDNSGRVA